MISTEIQNYINEIQEAEIKQWKANEYTLPHPIYGFNEGKKFIKITRNYCGQISVHCFVDPSNGNIYKAAGWNAPAKGVRGNINDAKKPLLGGDFYRYR